MQVIPPIRRKLLFTTNVKFKKVSDFILFSNIFIALCAVALCIETNILLHLPLNIYSFYCFVFGATLVQYNLHYLIKPLSANASERHLWSSGKKYIHEVLVTAGVACIFFSFIHFRLHHFIIIGFLGLIAFVYSFPVIPFGKRKRLKDFGFAKIITLSLMWTFVTVWFPAANFNIEKNLFLFVFFQRLAFMLVLCLLFDLRDIDIDRSENINTIVVLLGKKKSYLLTYFFLIIFMLISAGLFMYSHNKNAFTAMAVSACITFSIIYLTKKIFNDLFYLLCVDGLMLAQAVLAYLFVLIL